MLYPDKGGLWFLWALFFINVIFVLCSWLAERIKLKPEMVILFVCFLLIGIMTILDIRVFGFQFITYYFVFYSIGYYLHKYEQILLTKNVYVITVFAIIWAVMAWFWNMHSMPPFLNKLPFPATLMQYAYRFVTAFVAIYVLFCSSLKMLDGDFVWNKPFVKMGLISLGIYTTHFIMIGKIVSFMKDLFVQPFIIVILSYVIATLFSWFIVWMLSKWRVTSQLLLGKINDKESR